MKKFIFATLAVLPLLLVIMVLRAVIYGQGSKGDDIALPDVPAFDEVAALNHLSRAVQFKTITTERGDPATNEAAQPWLNFHKWLEQTYPVMHKTLTREKIAQYTLLYTWQGSDASLAPIMLMAHQDVVPVDSATASDWVKPPFEGAIDNDFIYGRGVLDDKGSLIGIVEAVENLAKSGFQPKRTILIAFGHDEETGGTGAQALVALLKTRGIRPEAVIDEGMFVIEDSPLSKGAFGGIGISEKGFVTFKLVSDAIGGHSSQPPRNSANVQLAKAILALENNQMPSYINSAPGRDTFKGLASKMPFARRFALANLWILGGVVNNQLATIPAANAMVRTTMAPTMLAGSVKENILPQKSTAHINFRIHPNDSAEKIFTHIERLIKDIEGVSVEPLETGAIVSNPLPISSTKTKTYNVLKSVAREIAGGENIPVVPMLVIAATDSRHSAEITENIYRFIPNRVSIEEIDGIHGTDEKMPIENMKYLVRGYMQIILAMDG